MRGHGEVVPETCIPGTDVLRTSVIVTWADVVTGSVAGSMITERIPLTLDLEVQVQEPARLGDPMVIEAAPLKAGRTVAVAEARVRSEDTGAPIAYAIATFFASPNPAHVFADGFPDLGDMPVGRLPEPLADRAGITIVEPGVAEVPHRGKNLNASNAIQGGIVSLAAEESSGRFTATRSSSTPSTSATSRASPRAPAGPWPSPWARRRSCASPTSAATSSPPSSRLALARSERRVGPTRRRAWWWRSARQRRGRGELLDALRRCTSPVWCRLATSPLRAPRCSLRWPAAAGGREALGLVVAASRRPPSARRSPGCGHGRACRTSSSEKHPTVRIDGHLTATVIHCECFHLINSGRPRAMASLSLRGHRSL